MTLGEFKKLIKKGDDSLDISSFLQPKEVIQFINPEISTETPPKEGNNPVFKHSVNPGDLVAAMGCMKKYYEITKTKVRIAQSLNIRAQYYAGATHPTVDEQGNNVTFNTKMWDMMKPLIESQEYIHSFEKYEGQRVDIDLDIIRGKTNINMPHGPIQGWIPLAFPDLSFDMSKPWVTLKDKCPEYIRKQVHRKVILNFTERYRQPMLEYYFLKNYAPDLIFAGTEKEHFVFCNMWQFNCPRLEVNDFLELAYGIREARFVLSNQSFIWNLAQSMQTPRVLEMVTFADNCFPMIGEDSYGYFYQVGTEYYFRVMYNKTQ